MPQSHLVFQSAIRQLPADMSPKAKAEQLAHLATARSETNGGVVVRFVPEQLRWTGNLCLVGIREENLDTGVTAAHVEADRQELHQSFFGIGSPDGRAQVQRYVGTYRRALESAWTPERSEAYFAAQADALLKNSQ